MGFGGSGGGNSSISGSNDVALSGLANSQVLSYDSATSKWKNLAIPGTTNTQIIVRYSGSAWEARPSSPAFGVLFLSTNSASAPAPNDVNLKAGDVWRRHPDAV
jgi:hypothetical protein